LRMAHFLLFYLMRMIQLHFTQGFLVVGTERLEQIWLAGQLLLAHSQIRFQQQLYMLEISTAMVLS